MRTNTPNQTILEEGKVSFEKYMELKEKYLKLMRDLEDARRKLRIIEEIREGSARGKEDPYVHSRYC